MTAADFWLLFVTDFLYLAAALRCNFCCFDAHPAGQDEPVDIPKVIGGTAN
jgi:hypothetical protein